MKFNTAKSIAFAAIIASSFGSSAFAKDWVEKVKISGAIDLVPISVKTDGIKYKVTTQKTHRFSFSLYAKAKSGKRIAKARVTAAYTGGLLESAGSYWTKSFADRAVANGTKRTWSKSAKFRINMRKIDWDGPNPVQACNAVLAKKLSQGRSRAAILGKVQKTSAYAIFQLRAAAARPSFATSGKSLSFKNRNRWTEESSSMRYRVSVRCLPKATPSNQVQTN